MTLPSLKLLSLILQLELGSCPKIMGSCCLKARVATHVAPGTRGQGSSRSKGPVGRKDVLQMPMNFGVYRVHSKGKRYVITW